nr:prefoldin subunit beta [Candidatus Woesearchaeota archaeon]
MKLDKDTEQKIAQLQIFEQNLQNFFIQRQTFQNQAAEIENALKELGNLKEDTAFKLVGNIMLKKKKKDLTEDLKSRKEVLELRIKNIEKQENKIKEKSKEIRDEVMKELEK